MNVIFLDVDGVLNSLTTIETTPDNYRGIEQSKVALLKNLVDETDAVLVLISDWKTGWESEDKDNQDSLANYLDECLAKEGLEIYDCTYEARRKDRGKGISEWLHEHKVKKWIVLDDETFDDFEKYHISEHLVLTAEYFGLTEDDVEEALIKMGVK